MFAPLFALLVSSLSSAEEASDPGVIRGVVVNASRNGTICPQTEVMLRVQIDGQFVPVASTTTDDLGGFKFADLPVGSQFLYLPGANYQDVHYPGQRVRLSGARPQAYQRLEVCDAVSSPNPLIIARQEILIEPQAGMLRVTESLRIKNASSTTYVGRAAREGHQPITLQLAIPPDFERTTFHKEFYGRNFEVVDNGVATTIPWTPGKRELKFTYTLPNEARHRVWQRPLDLPCEELVLRVRHDKPDEIACSLEAIPATAAGETAFAARGTTLPAGHVIRVELGRLPVPWTRYARWTALALLAGGLGASGLWMMRSGRRPASEAVPVPSPQSLPATHPGRGLARRAAKRQRAA
jgi:hypothetical protein